MRRFHHSSFADAGVLLARKAGQRLSVCIPTLNEAATIGGIVKTVRRELMEALPLVDELLVMDSGSDDGTRDIAARCGATVRLASETLPATGNIPGKGENLWKALQVSTGDIICYIDGDISNFHSGFVKGLLGPLLEDPGIDYVKAYYERPLANGGQPLASGGGRVSEILVRPLIALFYQELVPVLQPLSGEYAARRTVLEKLPFPTGYGVEIAHLIDLSRAGLLHRTAQCDLVTRVHRNRSEDDLGDTAFAILKVVLRRMERDGLASFSGPSPDVHQRWIIAENLIKAVSRHIPEPERPPVRP
jgi:glucosyl-3-phosphoglycerate synthase